MTTITRRILLWYAAPVIGALPRIAAADAADRADRADYTLRIADGLLELSPEHIISTTLYNGQFPGPLLRLKEAERVIVDVYNDTDTPELVHWHGRMISNQVDGASEEDTPLFLRRACVASGSCRSHRDFASITRMSWRVRI